ncbi:MAG: molybdopterin molybdotransferase MoeA [Lachnospiraceae bacterium]|nr:molybdopterin molybdotransferase MoeA [Lachnospiraceae bacterium]
MNPIPFEEARELLLEMSRPVSAEKVSLDQCAGRIVAEDIKAAENVPPFDRSPYDGYAFRADDTGKASKENPAVLRILEEIPAGGIPHKEVVSGTAVKILTGAPIPPGADAVCMYEKTEFSDTEVRIFKPFRAGDNIVCAGEDIRAGSVLVKAGSKVDAGTAGVLASQGIAGIKVYRRPVIGIISTGSELTEIGEKRENGKIYNSNRYTFTCEASRAGGIPLYMGAVPDDPGAICSLLERALSICDTVILTGGVSVGDYDYTARAMEMAGIRILVNGVSMKPGMACTYGIRDGKLVCGLSGNPASSLTNYYMVALPAIRRLAGISLTECRPREIPVILEEGYPKASPGTRFLRGRLDLTDGKVRMHIARDQGNVVLSSSIGIDVMAMVPAGSGPVEPGTALRGFLM